METEKILLVNDGSPILKTIGEALESKGCFASLTDTAEDALEELSQRYYDLVIMKLGLKHTDRLAVLNMIEELNPGTRLIIMSEEACLPMEAYQIEVDDYILMPCRSADLWRRISNCLKTLKSDRLTSPAPGPQPQVRQAVPVTGETPAQTQSKVDAINRRVLHKLGLMFHDVRGSLVAISAGLKLLNRRGRGKLGDDFDHLLKETGGRTHKLLATTEEFIENIFLSEGYGANDHNYYDLQQEVIEPVLEEFREDLQKKDLVIDNRLDFLPLMSLSTKGDKVALKSAFRNLISNAVKYSERGCTISIALEKDGANFRLQVYNPGPVIPKEHQSQIFARFTPLAHQGHREGQGLGIGLHLTREVLQSYGGDLQYEAKPNGANFVITWPNIESQELGGGRGA
ncbi:MAG: hybrid sensor histidine kinase/response regulator [Thermodesulfobacteriota bacterium]